MENVTLKLGDKRIGAGIARLIRIVISTTQ